MDERRLRGQTGFRFRDSIKSNASQSGVYTSVNIYIYHVTLTESRFLFVTKKREKQTNETDQNVQGTCDMLPLVNCVRVFEDKKAL